MDLSHSIPSPFSLSLESVLKVYCTWNKTKTILTDLYCCLISISRVFHLHVYNGCHFDSNRHTTNHRQIWSCPQPFVTTVTPGVLNSQRHQKQGGRGTCISLCKFLLFWLWFNCILNNSLMLWYVESRLWVGKRSLKIRTFATFGSATW